MRERLFLCTDGSWRHAVSRLFAYSDDVLLDACDYDAERAGLNWEVGQLVDRVAMANLVVLIDEGTDQAALCVLFRSAWAHMDGRSPNNRPDAAPVRWVVLESSAQRNRRTDAEQDLPPVADPLGLYKQLNPLLRPLVAGHYSDAVRDDRIFGLLAAEGLRHSS